jgi:bifunctional non-homologous end joining protein LigD
VLDGELVTGGGRLTDFYRVGPTLARRRPVPGHSITFAAFDVLWWDGTLMTRRSYAARRAVLDSLGLAELGVPTIPAFDVDDAPALFRACAVHGVEGLVLKELSAPYLPGKRTASWRKVKCEAWGEHRERRLPG